MCTSDYVAFIFKAQTAAAGCCASTDALRVVVIQLLVAIFPSYTNWQFKIQLFLQPSFDISTIRCGVSYWWSTRVQLNSQHFNFYNFGWFSITVSRINLIVVTFPFNHYCFRNTRSYLFEFQKFKLDWTSIGILIA